MITFAGIPITLRTPGQFIEMDNSRAVQGTSARPKVACIIAPMTSVGTATKDIPVRIVSNAAARTLLGVNSIGAAMVAAYRAINPQTELWAIPVDTFTSGTARVERITFVGTTTAAGTVHLYIGGRYIPVAIAASSDVTATALACKNAINAVTDISWTADSSSGVLSMTCTHKGAFTNVADFRLNYVYGQTLPAGISSATIAQTTPGATDASIANAVAAMGDVQYDSVVNPFRDDTNQDILETELLRRWGPLVQKYGQSFVGVSDTLANTSSYGNARNSFLCCALAVGASPTPEWECAAMVAALRDAQTRANIPYQGLALTGMLAPAAEDRFDGSERNVVLYDGMSTYTVDSGGVCRLERLITTYQTSAGVADPSYLDLTTPDTLDYLRYSVNQLIALRFPRFNLADDGTIVEPGSNVVTPNMIKSQILALALSEWEGIYCQGFDQFKTELIVERNVSDPNRVDMQMGPNLLGAFMVFAGQIQFLLGTAA